jgi:hypothetical protein
MPYLGLTLLFLLVSFVQCWKESAPPPDTHLYVLPIQQPHPRPHPGVYPVDCRVTITPCEEDADCVALCEAGGGGNEVNAVCRQRRCDYTLPVGGPTCLNGGQLIWHDYGSVRACTCPEEYFGPRCERANPFVRGPKKVDLVQIRADGEREH